ncbi:SDR family oxidoreductase, partial [bacterium]|nr:SDR family oxidoreductase [bacterium]
IECDVSDYASVKIASKEVKRMKKPVKAFINAAGVASMNMAVTTDESTVQNLIQTNLVGTIYCCQLFAPIMLRQKQGSFINFSTIAVSLALKGESVYAASKAGVESFSRTFAREMADFNVRVNCIAPFYRDDVVVELKFNDQIICVVREVVSLKEPPDRNEGGTYQYGLMPYLKRQALEGYLRYEKEIDDLVEIDAVLEQHCEWYPLVLDGYGNTQANYESNEPAISMYPIVGTEKYRHGFCRIQKQYDAKSIIASASAAVVKSEPDDQKKT